MGNYDDEEFERRERLAHIEDPDSEDVEVVHTDYQGSLEYDAGASADALLERFHELKSE